MNAGEQLVHYEVSDIQELERILDKNHAKIESQFNRRSLPEITRCYLCTPSFATWWSKYFTSHAAHIDSDFSHMILPPKNTYSREKNQGKSSTTVEGTGAYLGEGSHSPSNSEQSRFQQNVPSKKRCNPSYVAHGSMKRNIKGLSKGSSSGKSPKMEGPPVSNPALTTTIFLRSRKLKTIFVNTETSPIDADEEGKEEIETDRILSDQVDRTTLTRLGSSQNQPQNILASALVLYKSMSPDLDLGKILLEAKLVYSSGGKVVPSSHETHALLEARVEPEVVEILSSTTLPSVSLATIAGKVLGYLAFLLEVLVANDARKSEFINATTSLQAQLSPVETKLGQLLEDFISKIYSTDILSLESRKQDLDSIANNLSVLHQLSAKYAEAVSHIVPVLEQSKESEQKMVLRIKALEDELVEARTSLTNIRATNGGLSEKLKHFEQAKDSNVSATSVVESDLKKASEACTAVEHEVEKLTKQQAYLRLSLNLTFDLMFKCLFDLEACFILFGQV
ncbi:hypothetical protein PIB30_077957 [Stylosanthes scabra]|uniref:Uncharacterized protein n=1 Tax=Stylosanthes scabra TaxID=79078 RepID=A0ABU6VPU8_9FABA|nr:hypothetical protein [Stylosanthes scabra]